MSLSFKLDKKEQEFLGKQAILAIQSQLDGDQDALPLTPPGDLETGKNQSLLMRLLGSFVTLNIGGRLRGCIGSIIGHEPLYLNVWNMARQAAFNDPRFPPLTKDEWPAVTMEISVLDEPSPCLSVDQIEIGRDGLILQYAGRTGLFLPQVPVENHWNVQEYLKWLCAKAGVPDGSWKKPGARLFWFQAQVFSVRK